MVLAGCASHYHRLENDSVAFFLKAPEASSVLFASSLDGFRAHPAVKADDKTWIARVPAPEGEFSYFYIVDGAVFVPECPYREYDEFGSENCVYVPGM